LYDGITKLNLGSLARYLNIALCIQHSTQILHNIKMFPR